MRTASMQVEVVKTLLGEGASVALTDRQGNTALHYAAGYGRVDALRMLLDAGANAAEVNGNGKNALELVKYALPHTWCGAPLCTRLTSPLKSAALFPTT